MNRAIFTIICIILLEYHAVAAVDIWVSTSGSKLGDGSKEKPFASLNLAVRKARELRRLHDVNIADGVQIIIEQGTYFLDEPLQLRPEDSGTANSPTTIKAADGAHVVLSGGMKLGTWKKAPSNIIGLPKEARGKIWVLDSPTVAGRQLDFRQLWINGNKAERASNFSDAELDRILSVDKENEIQWIPKPDFDLKETKQLEFFIHQWWAVANLRVKSMKVIGDSCAVTFHQPESKIQFEHPWPAPYIDTEKNKNGNSAFYFVNAIELLNKEGEWYHDLKAGKLYYYPKATENMAQVDAIVPVLENLVQITGSIDEPVAYVRFENIKFHHAAWNRPSTHGHVALQAGFYFHEAYSLKVPGTPDKANLENQAWLGRQEAAVKVRYASNLTFELCAFEHLAATGFDLVEGTSHNLVEACLFNDIGGSAINIGFFGDEAFEAHRPFAPTDERLVCHHETIRNNLINDATNEDWGCVGIGAGFVSDILIEHNEIRNLNYSGVSLGWGWTGTVHCMKNNMVTDNYIHHFAKNMYDVAGIYTLGMQPNTELRGNRIENLLKAPYAHDPEHYQYLYLDENSSYIRVINNWTEKDKFFSNSPGPGNFWENNGPQVSDSIKNNAGIQEKYQQLLKQ
ncbi:MAG: right-handed parallel beta-helix repeat-containing protein [Mangrovibacterium sp.]